MADLALLLGGDGIPALLVTLGWIAFGLLVAPVVPRLARDAGMTRAAAWTCAVIAFGPLGLAAFVWARRKHGRFVAAMREAGIEPAPAEAADPAVRRAGDAKLRTGLVLVIVGLVLSVALSGTAGTVVFVGLIVGGAVMAARGALQRGGRNMRT